MTKYEEDQGAAEAREISMLSPYVIGKTLRRWYLRKLIDHHVKSAQAEVKLAQQHNDSARYLLTLATAARGALEDLDGVK
jgi:hypothetical protein